MPLAILFLTLLIIFIIFYIPPINIGIIFLLILLITSDIFLILKLITKNKKYSLFFSSFIFIILIFSALKILEPVNLILTLSFFGLVFTLIK